MFSRQSPTSPFETAGHEASAEMINDTLQPPAYWNNLSPIVYTRSAIAEFNRRAAERRRQIRAAAKITKPARRLLRSDTARLKRIAQRGGLNLVSLRGTGRETQACVSATGWPVDVFDGDWRNEAQRRRREAAPSPRESGKGRPVVGEDGSFSAYAASEAETVVADENERPALPAAEASIVENDAAQSESEAETFIVDDDDEDEEMVASEATTFILCRNPAPTAPEVETIHVYEDDGPHSPPRASVNATLGLREADLPPSSNDESPTPRPRSPRRASATAMITLNDADLLSSDDDSPTPAPLLQRQSYDFDVYEPSPGSIHTEIDVLAHAAARTAAVRRAPLAALQLPSHEQPSAETTPSPSPEQESPSPESHDPPWHTNPVVAASLRLMAAVGEPAVRGLQQQQRRRRAGGRVEKPRGRSRTPRSPRNSVGGFERR